jgi:hypothetical protein
VKDFAAAHELDDRQRFVPVSEAEADAELQKSPDDPQRLVRLHAHHQVELFAAANLIGSDLRLVRWVAGANGGDLRAR